MYCLTLASKLAEKLRETSMIFKTLDYFARNVMDPTYEVFEVLDDRNHPLHNDLMLDIENIIEDDLSMFVKSQQIDGLLGRQEDKNLGRRIYYIIFNLQHEITNARILKLLNFNDSPEPYNSNNLSTIKIDKNSLAATNQFDLKKCGFQYNNLIYELCPTNGGSNSSYWLYQAIFKSIIDSGVNFKIRLDPFREIESENYQPMTYRMIVHGKPLNWEKLVGLRNEDFGQWFNERDYSITDYVWAPADDEIHFTCEEYSIYSQKEMTTSRYFHAIFNKKTGGIKHCDGAIRVYNDFEILLRKNFHVRQAEVRKVGKRIKIFQFDSQDNLNREILREDFTQLVVSFFVWNNDVQNYFSKNI